MGTFLEQFLSTLLLVFILLLTSIYIYFKYKYTYWSRKNIQHLEPMFPFGSAKGIFLQQESFGDCFANIYKKLKEKTKVAGGYFFFSEAHLMPIDPEIIKIVLTSEFNSFHDRDFYVDEENDPLTAHLVGLRGSEWKNIRAKMTPTFTAGKMKMMFQTISDCTRDLEDVINTHIEKCEAIDIRDIFARLTTDTIVSCAFGVQCNSIKDPQNKFRKYGKMIFEFGIRERLLNALVKNCPWLLKVFKISRTKPEVSSFFMKTLRNIVEYREKNNVTRRDFLDLLIRLKNNKSVLEETIPDLNVNSNSEQGLTFNQVAAQAFVFFAAGFETTSSTLGFSIFELALNPKIQQAVRQEIRDVMCKYDGVLSYDAVMSMKFMDKVIYEVLRKYPPIPVLSRECTNDYKLHELNYTIKRGSIILISTLGIHYDPEYYPEPEKFKPERFSEAEKTKRHPSTYLPFGEGPRLCIGMRFALLQMKIVLSVLLKNFEFRLDPRTPVPIRFSPKSLFLAPTDIILVNAGLVKNI